VAVEAMGILNTVSERSSVRIIDILSGSTIFSSLEACISYE
jgi:hypothetical protein